MHPARKTPNKSEEVLMDFFNESGY